MSRISSLNDTRINSGKMHLENVHSAGNFLWKYIRLKYWKMFSRISFLCLFFFEVYAPVYIVIK